MTKRALSRRSIVPTELRERLAAPAKSVCVTGTSTGSLSLRPAAPSRAG
jgi:hypothetical protein